MQYEFTSPLFFILLMNTEDMTTVQEHMQNYIFSTKKD